MANDLVQTGGTSSRLDDPNDFVRLEISAALARNIRITPVLVDNMTMPSEKMLPTSLMKGAGYVEGKNLLLDIPNVKAYDELCPISRGYAETKVNVIVTQGGTATVIAREATKAKARWFRSDATCCLCMFRFVHLMLAVRRFQSAVLLTRVYQGNKETRMKMAFRHNNKNYAGINTDPARTVAVIVLCSSVEAQ